MNVVDYGVVLVAHVLHPGMRKIRLTHAVLSSCLGTLCDKHETAEDGHLQVDRGCSSIYESCRSLSGKGS